MFKSANLDPIYCLSAFVQFLHNRLVSEQGDLFKFVHQCLLERAVDPVVIMLLLIWMEKEILRNMEVKDKRDYVEREELSSLETLVIRSLVC